MRSVLNGMAKNRRAVFALATLILTLVVPAFGSEAELHLPPLDGTFALFGTMIAGTTILWAGIVVCLAGLAFGVFEISAIKNLPAHKSMLEVSHLIFETCKTYMLQQGKMLMVFEAFIGACMVYYFGVLQHMPMSKV